MSVYAWVVGPDITEGNPLQQYGTRRCKCGGGHWHVTTSGEDISVPGDPFATQEAAQAMADVLNESHSLSVNAAHSFLMFEAARPAPHRGSQ